MDKRAIGKRLVMTLLCLCMALAFVSCKEEESGPVDYGSVDFSVSGNIASLDEYDTKNPVVAMKLEGYGTIIIELYPDKAPNTVNNFISLVKSGFYDNNTIHRAQAGFVVQGGDPNGNGSGGPGYSIKGEFSLNGVNNTLKHTRGVLSMARSEELDSAGSQFFIVLESSPLASNSLDGKYAAFGMVIEGMNVVDKIVEKAEIINTQYGILKDNVTIAKALVDTKGVEYPEPDKITK